MSLSPEKTTKTTVAHTRQHQPGQTLFRKPGEGFFDRKQAPFFKSPIQTKLSVNTPGDAHEQEADAIADKVMRMPAAPAAPAGGKDELQRKKEEGLQEEDHMLIGETDPAPLRRKAMEKDDRMQIGEADPAPLNRISAGMHDEEDRMRIGDIDTAPLQRKEEEEKLQAQGEGTPAVTPTFEQSLQNSKGSGAPLPDNVRGQMETGIGADFSNVRIHTGTQAAQMSGSINAQAFTHGSNIYFNKGKYDPGTDSGRHLLAHELTHTVQQGAAGTSVQRSPGNGDGKRVFTVKIPPGTKSREEFRRYAELQIFGRVLNLEWTATPGAENLYQDISNHIGESISFTVDEATLKQYQSNQKKDTQTTGKDYSKLDGGTKKGVDSEIDKRYYHSTGITPGTKIKPGETGRAEMWNDFKHQVMEQKRSIDNLPPAVKEFLQSDKTFTPENYQELSEIAALLNQFDAADFFDYKSKVNFETTDLAELKRSIAGYLAQKKERQKGAEKREAIKTKLYGTEALYKEYKRIMSGDAPAPTSAARADAEKPEKQVNREVQFMRDWEALGKSLAEYGFGEPDGTGSVEAFGKYVDAYEAAFRKETIAIAGDFMQRYRHQLFEEEKKITNDTYVTNLFKQISGSGASKKYADAESKETEAKRLMLQELPDVEETQKYLRLSEEFPKDRKTAETTMKGLPDASPLMQEEGFDNETLSKVTSKDELRTVLQSYINKKRASIDETWEDINSHKDRVYELDKLIPVSKEMQGATGGNIYELIVNDKISDMAGAKLLKAICFIIVGIVLAIASFGTGIPAILAAGGSLLLSSYAVYEEIEKYKNDSNAHDVGLLSDDPTLLWVILAIIGAGLDAAAVSSAFKAARPIAEATTAFNKSAGEAADLVKLEKDLAAVKDISAQIRSNIVKSAEAQGKARQMIKTLLKTDGTLRMVIVPGGEQFAKLVAAAYYMAKSGVNEFASFILRLKAEKIISEAIQLTGKEKLILEDVFNISQKLTKSDAAITARIEKMIGDQNFTSLERLAKNIDKIQQGRREFEALGSEWKRINPHTGKEMFSYETGGYVALHNGHNSQYPHEFSMAEAYADKGYKVKLLNEKAAEGIPTPDAEIEGVGIFDFKNISPKAQTKNIAKNVHDYVLGANRQGENIAFNMADNPNATVDLVKQGIADAIETAHNAGLSLPKKVGLVYSDGKAEILDIASFKK